MNIDATNNTLAVERLSEAGYTVKAVGTTEELLFMLTVLIGSVAETTDNAPELLGIICGGAAASMAKEDRTEIDLSHLLKHMQGGNSGSNTK